MVLTVDFTLPGNRVPIRIGSASWI